MKKMLGILLAFCFVMSVTAAAVSAAPNDGKIGYNNHNDGKNKYDNHYGKKKYQMKGHWGYKKVKHNKDKKHKSFWFSNERYWIPGYWYWK